jgi:N-acetylmuramoyl-L-alanine amidase
MSVRHVASENDCIESIALQYGLLPDFIWNAPENAALRELRRNRNVLSLGDVVLIPDLREETRTGATEQRHRYLRKGVPARIEFRVLRFNRPVKDAKYSLIVDDTVFDGTTDGDGVVRCAIQPNARSAELRVQHEDEDLVYDLNLGAMDPEDELTGTQKRLTNLGYYVPAEEHGELGAGTRAAVARFQADNGLEPTGEPDDVVRNKIRELNGY